MNLNYPIQNEATTSAVDAHLPFNDTKIEFISPVSTKFNDKMKRQAQRVRFAKVECTYQSIDDTESTTTPSKIHDDGEEIDQASHLWYQTEDFKKFRSDDKKLMRVYRNLIKQKQRVPVGTMDDENLKFIDEQIANLEDEIRGLEDYKSIRANIDFKHRRYACGYAVMKEQARQRKLFLFQQKRMKIDDEMSDGFTWISSSNFELDATSIRNCVLDTSMKSKLLAFTLGLSDASYVRQMNSVDAGFGSAVDEEKENVDEKHYELCIVEVDEQRVYNKVPPRCENVDDDMTASPASRYKMISPISAKKTTASSILRNLQLRHLLAQAPYISCT